MSSETNEESKGIIPKVIEEEMKTAYINYAMSVIVGRALPDVRDGLKPVHRRILYAMYDMGLLHNKSFKKCARIVGQVLGAYHPHGDSSVYDALVRMAQDFSLRYPLIKGQGNFGCFTKDTKVQLTDGRCLSFKNLIEEHKKGKKNYTFTVNSKGTIEIAEIKNPRLTKKKQKILKIILDNEEEIKCTLDHRFMLKNGKYKEAQKLETSDSLMPLYLRLSTDEDNIKPALVGYQMAYQPKVNEWVGCHVLADNWNVKYSIYAKSTGKIRHHLDFNKLNNNPTNVKRMLWAEHWKLHAKHASELHKDPEYCKKIAEGRKKFWSEEENRIKSSKRLSEVNKKNWQNQKYQKHMRKVLSEVNLKYSQKHPELRKEKSKRLKKLWNDEEYKKKMSLLKSKEMKKNDPSLRRFTSEESKKIWENPEHRKSISKKSKEMWKNDTYRRTMGEKSKARWEDEEYKAKFPKNHFSEMAKKLWRDSNFREKFISRVKASNTKRLQENPDLMNNLAQKAAAILKEKWQNPSYKEKVMKSKVLKYVNTLIKKYPQITPEIYLNQRKNNCIPKIETALQYFDDFSDIVEQAKKYNHRIVSAEILSKREDVYDLTIECSHNFALAAGVFVHNSIDGDSAAAYRYTEAKLPKLAEEMLRDIEKNTVNFTDNFDASLKEPTVLPSKFPNLLVNGSSGIAVGMATNIPPHNINEICNGAITIIDNPEVSTEELMQIIPGPDFPTGAEVSCGTGLLSAYGRGRGKVIIKAIASIEDDKIIFSEIPYQVNKEELIQQIADLVRNKTIEGIRNINDESDREGIRIVVDLKKDIDGNVILNQLYKYSRLKISFGINMLALVDNQPKTLGLKDILSLQIDHRKEIIIRRTQYDLEQAEKRVHILEGLLIALNNIDDVIPGIKNSRTVEEAKEFLMNTYSLSEIQAKAILDMRLQKLASLEQEKIREEHKELIEKIKYLKEILESEMKVLSLIKEELEEIKQNYGDERRSKIVHGEDEDFDIEELIEEETVVVTMTNSGYAKRLPLDTYKTQRRGGKGVKAAGTKEEDFVERLYVSSTHDYLLVFTDKGQLYWLKVYQIPEGSRQSKGKHIANLLQMKQDEKINAIIPVRDFKDGYLFMATRKGTVKKTSLMDFSNPRKGGIRAINLDDDDILVGVNHTTGIQEIILATRSGFANRFNEKDVRPIGRAARGVRGIRLKNQDDEVIGMLAAEEGLNILTLTEKGYGKRTPVSEYRLCNRGGKGVTNIKVTDKNGPVKTVMLVAGNEEIMLVSKDGIGIRIPCSGISVIGRATQGVRVMRLGEGDKVAAAAKIIIEDDEDDNLIRADTQIPPPDDNQPEDRNIEDGDKKDQDTSNDEPEDIPEEDKVPEGMLPGFDESETQPENKNTNIDTQTPFDENQPNDEEQP